MNAQEKDTKLKLDYRKTSSGPQLLIFGSIDGDFSSLQALFRQLSVSPGKSVELHKQPFVYSAHGVKITLSCFTPKHGKRQTFMDGGLQRSGQTEESVFEWVKNGVGWDTYADLIDTLVKSSTPCHQYFDSYSGDDAKVIVSKGEYSDGAQP